MIKIDTAYFDFRMEDEGFAHGLYGQWDGFCRVAFEKVVDDVLLKYDKEDEIVQFETITLDLGTIPESEFYERFPVLLAERLALFFTEYLLYGNDSASVVKKARRGDKVVEWLMEYLLHGRLCWDMPEEYGDLSCLLSRSLEESAKALAASLRYHGEYRQLRERLVLQFTDGELEAVVRAVEPSEHLFINGYARYLRGVRDRRKRPEIAENDHRNAVWLLIFAYLLYDGKDFFSRKQFVYQTLAGLAARYNMNFVRMLSLVTAGLQKVIVRQVMNRELLQILQEIKREQEQGRVEDEITLLTGLVLKDSGELPEDSVERLCKLLAGRETCRRLLLPLKEDEIYRFVCLVVPAESDFVISYAKALDQGQQRDMFEGKAGSEFRLLKWEFLFQVLLNDAGSLFDRKRFVYQVLKRLAAHYNLEVLLLLDYFLRDTGGLPDWLPEVLRLLFSEQQEKQPLRLLEASVYRELTGEECHRLIRLLGHPQSCHIFLTGLREEQIQQLAGIVCPAESPFMVDYARALEQQKVRGAFEGRAGKDFRIIKWEFIFFVVLSRPFNRKQFVYDVLHQLSVHYNLETNDLLEYFWRSFTDDECPVPDWLMTLLTELRNEHVNADPASLLDIKERRCRQLACVEEFILTGVSRFVTGDVYTVFSSLCREAPDELRLITERFRERYTPAGLQESEPVMRFYAAFLLWVIRYYGLCFTGHTSLVALLEKAEAGKIAVSSVVLRQLIYYSLVNNSLKFSELLRQLPGSAALECKTGKEEAGTRKPGIEMKEPDPEMIRQIIISGSGKELFQMLEVCSQKIREYWQGGKTDERRIFDLLAGNKALQILWVNRIGNMVLRTVANELLEMQRRSGGIWDEQICWNWLVEFTDRRYVNHSYIEILERLWQKIRQYLSDGQYRALRDVVLSHPERWPFWKQALMNIEGDESMMQEVERVKEETGNVRFYIKNAGLVLLSPWYPRLFSMLGYTEHGKEFADKEVQGRAIFVLQYLLGDGKESPEFELLLNKLLVGYVQDRPLPRRIELSEQERAASDSMLTGVMQNWDKMQNTTKQGFIESFLLREGVLQERQEYWHLRVESRAYDMLLDTLPWGFTPVKYPWMNKPLMVEWR